MSPRAFWRRLVNRLRGGGRNRRLDEEIQFHLERQIERNRAAGMSPAEARRAALLKFGGVEPFKERARDEFRTAAIADFGRDLRTSARALLGAPGFAGVAVLTVGLGTGAATAMFSVVRHVLLRPLPYPESERIVRLYQIDEQGRRQGNVSQPNFDDWRAGTRSFEAMTTIAPWGPTGIVGDDEPHLASVTVVSGGFFDVMGVDPAIGRPFAADEQRVGGTPAALVSRAYWRTRMGGSSIANRALRVGDRAYAVIGVMPDGFEFPGRTAVWLAREIDPPDQSRTAHNYQALGRLRRGVPLAAAQAEIGALSRALKARYGDGTWMSDATAVPLLDQLTASSRPALALLFGASALLLLVACINVSSLLVARAATRRHEFAVRLALGAGRLRLVRQLLSETLVLCAAGGLLGVLVATWAVPGLVALGPGLAPRLDEARVDWAALAFGLGVSTMAAFALAVATSFGIRQVDLAPALSDGRRTGTAGKSGMRARQSLVAAEVAITLVLLVASGLLARSFARLVSIDPGYRLDDALVADMTLTAGGNDYRTRRIAIVDEILPRLRALPGVRAVAFTSGFPLGGGNYSNGQFLEMTSVDEIQSPEDVAALGPAAKGRAGQAGFRIVDGGYFEAMGIPLVRGRTFDAADAIEAPHVAVISQALADSRWPDRDPIGRYVQFGNMDGDPRGFRVVGVVGDVRELTLEAPPEPTFYVSYRQRPSALWRASLLVRGPDPDTLQPLVRRVVREVDATAPVEFRTVQAALEVSLQDRRFSLTLIGLFSAAALVVATLGVYGLVSYLVAQRTREIGIRIALGATPSAIRRAIVASGARMALIGGGVGLGLSALLARVLEGLLFGVEATDPAVLAGVMAVTLASAACASYVPALRATRVSPVDTLRQS